MTYPKAPIYETILSTELKNTINKVKGTMKLEFKLLDINNKHAGCRGFIRNTYNDTIVYVVTDDPLADGYLRRYARNTEDYEGGINQFSKSLKELAKDVIKMLEYRVAFNPPPTRIIDKNTGKRIL